MVRKGRKKLPGIVKVDETYIGGKEIGTGKQGRGAEENSIVVVATECIGRQIGRVRFKKYLMRRKKSLSAAYEQEL